MALPTDKTRDPAFRHGFGAFLEIDRFTQDALFNQFLVGRFAHPIGEA